MNTMHNILYKLIVFFIILICFGTKSFGQNFHGRVLDSEDFPIYSAAIIAQDGNSKTIATCVTDTCGYFSFFDLPIPYKLIVSHLGYKSTTIVDSVKNLTIRLEDAATSIDEVTVKGNLPMRVNELGALQYAGNQILQHHPVRNALDMLDEISVIQRIGNEYSIIGTTSFSLLINGKSKGMSQEQICTYLSSLSPNRVKNIEVYYNSPTKFGVRGASVNISLIEEKEKSFKITSELYEETITRHNLSEKMGVNIGLLNKKLSLYLSYDGGYAKKKSINNLCSNHYIQENLFHVTQEDVRRSNTFSNNLFVDANYLCADKSSLSFSYILQEELPKVNSTAATNINAQSQNSKLFTRTPTWLHNANLSFLHNNMEIGTNVTLYTQKENQLLEKAEENKIDETYKQNSNKYEVYMNGEKLIMGGNFIFGIKGYIVSTSSEKKYAIGESSNDLLYFVQKEQTAQIHMGYRHSLSKKGFLNISLGTEYFHSTYAKNHEHEKKLWSQWQVYPSLTCVYRPTSRSVLQLSLNSEKRYPTYWTTAANRVYMNTYCASDGNTALKPYVKYSGNLNYIIKSKYIFGIFAETSPNFFTQNMILNRTELLAVYKYLNFSQNYRYGLMAIIPVKWTPNISSKFTTMAFNMHQSGKVEDDFSFNKKKTSGILRLTNNFVLFRKKINVEFSGWYQFPIIQGMYDVSRMCSTSIGFTWYTGLEGLTFTFRGEDIFDTYRMKTKCNIDNMNYAFNNKIDMRMFSLTIRYKFKDYKEKKKKTLDSSRYGL